MRRLWAMLLLVLFSFSLIGPAFATAESQLPECCRRLGQHHCAMPQGHSPGAGLRNTADQCPYFPAGPAVPVYRYAPLLSATPAVPVFLVTHPAGQVQSETCHRASFYSSHQKRGPPARIS